jgi:BlaI family penicillinase repressor
MDLVYQAGSVSASDVHTRLTDPPTYTTVRGLLRVLVEKGHLKSSQEGKRYIYQPSTPRPAAGASSIEHVVRTFFAGSPTDAMAALLGSRQEISTAELDRLAELVARARQGKRARS